MRRSTVLIVWLVFAVASATITPPDLISQITVMLGMFIVYGLIIFAVSRLGSFKQAPESVKNVIVALACLLSIATLFSAVLYERCRQRSVERYEYPASEEPNDAAGR